MMTEQRKKLSPGASLAVPSAAQSRRLVVGTRDSSRSGSSRHPGYSLFEWKRLCESGQDLARVGGRLLHVTEVELARHSKEEDAWTAVRGKVYNITPFLRYHPGGKARLMQGAGIDCTELFDKIHVWVSEEATLQQCLVGVLVPSSDTSGSVPQEKNLVKGRTDDEQVISIQVPCRTFPRTFPSPLGGYETEL